MVLNHVVTLLFTRSNHARVCAKSPPPARNKINFNYFLNDFEACEDGSGQCVHIVSFPCAGQHRFGVDFKHSISLVWLFVIGMIQFLDSYSQYWAIVFSVNRDKPKDASRWVHLPPKGTFISLQPVSKKSIRFWSKDSLWFWPTLPQQFCLYCCLFGSTCLTVLPNQNVVLVIKSCLCVFAHSLPCGCDSLCQFHQMSLGWQHMCLHAYRKCSGR